MGKSRERADESQVGVEAATAARLFKPLARRRPTPAYARVPMEGGRAHHGGASCMRSPRAADRGRDAGEVPEPEGETFHTRPAEAKHATTTHRSYRRAAGSRRDKRRPEARHRSTTAACRGFALC